MLNSCTFIGNLGKNPIIKTMSNGKEVASFSIACSEYWKNKNNEWETVTQWIPITAFAYIDKVKSLRTGDKVFVQGKFKTRDYEKDGVKKYITEIVVQGYDSKIMNLAPKEKTSEHQQQKANGYVPETNFVDDENIPF